jgi:hypothetical protein
MSDSPMKAAATGMGLLADMPTRLVRSSGIDEGPGFSRHDCVGSVVAVCESVRAGTPGAPVIRFRTRQASLASAPAWTHGWRVRWIGWRFLGLALRQMEPIPFGREPLGLGKPCAPPGVLA